MASDLHCFGWLKGQSEMTLNGMSSDLNNAVKQFGFDFNEIDVTIERVTSDCENGRRAEKPKTKHFPCICT